MARIRYRITVRGRLTEHLRLAFDGLGMEPGGEQTALIGEIRDQAHLYGVLDLVRELGLELVSVAPDARQNQSLLSERDRGACLPAERVSPTGVRGIMNHAACGELGARRRCRSFWRGRSCFPSRTVGAAG
jgi:hypothetical protein